MIFVNMLRTILTNPYRPLPAGHSDARGHSVASTNRLRPDALAGRSFASPTALVCLLLCHLADGHDYRVAVSHLHHVPGPRGEFVNPICALAERQTLIIALSTKRICIYATQRSWFVYMRRIICSSHAYGFYSRWQFSIQEKKHTCHYIHVFYGINWL